MKNQTWRYLIGIFLILLGGLFLVEQITEFSIPLWRGIMGAVMIGGGVLFLGAVLRSRENWWGLITGLPLLLMGAGLLLSIFNERWEGLVGIGFMLGLGLGFIITYLVQKPYWWALIPGVILSGIAVSNLLEMYLPGQYANLGSFIVLASIGLAFVLVFLSDRKKWWALFPAGALLSTSALIVFDQVAFLFIGLGITFALVPLLVGKEQNWGWIVSAVMLILGMGFLFFTVATESVSRFFFPVLLIVLGVAAIIQVLLPRKR